MAILNFFVPLRALRVFVVCLSNTLYDSACSSIGFVLVAGWRLRRHRHTRDDDEHEQPAQHGPAETAAGNGVVGRDRRGGHTRNREDTGARLAQRQ